MVPPGEVTPLSPGRTIGAMLLIVLATVLGRLAAMLAVGLALGRIDLGALAETTGHADGLLFSVGILGAAATGGATMWAILRRHEPSRYLALALPRGLALAVLTSLALVALFDAARWFTTGALMPAVWAQTYASAGSLPLLLLALVVVAPIFEETLFRGFLFRGLAASRLGPAGTIAVTSLLFTLAHGPEDLLDALDPLAAAILLGIIRHRSGSITAGILVHALGNLQAIVMVGLMSAS